VLELAVTMKMVSVPRIMTIQTRTPLMMLTTRIGQKTSGFSDPILFVEYLSKSVLKAVHLPKSVFFPEDIGICSVVERAANVHLNVVNYLEKKENLDKAFESLERNHFFLFVHRHFSLLLSSYGC